MLRIAIIMAATMISAASLSSTAALAQFSEPAAYQSQHPDRDVLNGGQLTPAGRAALGQPQYENPNAAYAAAPYASPGAPVLHSRRRHQHR